jgi:hypothetical protein
VKSLVRKIPTRGSLSEKDPQEQTTLLRNSEENDAFLKNLHQIAKNPEIALE